jgi:alpha-beta hydrolase superfamily lysophospholipase
LNEARPHFIPQDGNYLFAWHHPAHPDRRRHAAIVMCPSIFGEFVGAYRVWRALAGQLADSGFDVFRFDYEGTGDSAGVIREPERVDAWLRNIERVIQEARDVTGARQVALVGLRIGATMALHAAAAIGGVDRLVLWSPFRSGRAYVRELRAFARLAKENYVTKIDDGPDIPLAGYILPASVASEFERLDVDSLMTAPARHILLVEHDERPTDPTIGAHLRSLGSCLTCIRPVGTAKMLDPGPTFSVPGNARDAVARWLDEWPTGRPDVLAEPRPGAASDMAHGSGFHEHAVRFGPAERLFGILSAPNGADSDAPAIVLLNTGYECRIGPRRFYVPLAREWAEQGHVVFRYDLGGIGDSEAPAGCGDNVAYPDHALDDAREAIEFVRAHAPGRMVIVAGLCAGGWHAFRAAREGLAVDAIVSINPPLYLRDGMVQTESWNDYQQVETYRTALREPARWARALRGQSSYRSFFRLAASHAKGKLKGLAGSAFGGRLVDGLARDLVHINARGITSLFVFSRGDGGLEYFQLHAGPMGRRRARHGISHVIVDDAGHTFNPAEARQTLRELLMEFVAERTREARRGSSRSQHARLERRRRLA